MLGIPSVWGEMTDGMLPEAIVPAITIAPTLQTTDAVSGPTAPDTGQPTGRTHGRTRSNVANTQTPLPVSSRGPSGLGSMALLTAGGELIAKMPAMMAAAGDVVGSVMRGQRYRAISRIAPESTTASIGAVARQSYQYVQPLVPYPYPSNAFGNPNIGGEVRQIDATIPPALEPPRYNLTAIDTDYLQQQHDMLITKALLAERGMGNG